MPAPRRQHDGSIGGDVRTRDEIIFLLILIGLMMVVARFAP